MWPMLNDGGHSDYVRGLEDEVMSLRATVQVLKNAFSTHDKTIVRLMQELEVARKDASWWHKAYLAAKKLCR